MKDPRRPLDNAANAGLLAHLGAPARRAAAARAPASCDPDTVEDPYTGLGSHPDMVQRLWDELDPGLPARCRWVVYGAPVLAHPDTGTIFAFAGGTVYALRLPPAEREAARRLGADDVHDFPAYPDLGVDASTLDLRAIGPGWVFGAWRREEPAWCLAAFHDAAGASC